MRKKYFQFQRNEQSEIVSELHQCFWGGLSEVWEKTKITLCFTHIQEGWQEFSRKLVTSKIYFEAVTFPAAALRGSPHSSHNQVLLWDEQACLPLYNSKPRRWQKGKSLLQVTSSREDTGRDNIETCTNTKAFYHIWKPIINWQILKIISAEPTADFSGNNSRGAPVSNSCKLTFQETKSFSFQFR